MSKIEWAPMSEIKLRAKDKNTIGVGGCVSKSGEAMVAPNTRKNKKPRQRHKYLRTKIKYGLHSDYGLAAAPTL